MNQARATARAAQSLPQARALFRFHFAAETSIGSRRLSNMDKGIVRMQISRLLALAARARAEGDWQFAAQLIDQAMALAEKVEAESKDDPSLRR
ncbi:MAG TPA: hypothetical protein VKW08_20185 [Xanthobacteraceae bacterium]|nr:hypothetical protein [Xanthobacteraceae bacterium]